MISELHIGYQSTLTETVQSRRATLTFCVKGLAAREEVLFKGYVRLLDHVTEHEWRHQEASLAHPVDLLVLDEAVEPVAFQQLPALPQPVLRLGTSSASRPFFLSWPLKPYELENELNRLGQLISSQHTPHLQVKAVLLGSTASPTNDQPTEKLMRLRRWPLPRLLAEPGRMRLATLLSGKAMGMDELLHRSALSKKICQRFINDMQTADLLMLEEAHESTHPEEVARLSGTPAALASASASAYKQAVMPSAKPVVQPGLLTRIRLRLGMHSAGNALRQVGCRPDKRFSSGLP